MFLLVSIRDVRDVRDLSRFSEAEAFSASASPVVGSFANWKLGELSANLAPWRGNSRGPGVSRATSGGTGTSTATSTTTSHVLELIAVL